MIALRFSITCPECGGQLDKIADGRVEPRRTVTAVRCRDCTAEQFVTVTLEQTRRPRPTARIS